MTWWADVNARARGLAGHLLDAPARGRVQAAPDLPSLCRELQRFGYPLEPGVGARTAERAVERVRSERQALLLRWLGKRCSHVRFVLEADDRRAIRALVRGAEAGLPASARVAAVPPACGVPEGWIRSAADTATPEEALSRLADLGQPLAERARVEREELMETSPDLPPLLAVELALGRAWAGRAVEGGKRGGAEIRRAVALAVDLENAWSALVLAPSEGPLAAAAFLDGGGALSRDDFEDALAAPDRATCRARIADVLPGPLATPFLDPAIPATRLEHAVLALAVREQERELRRAPLGPAPLLACLLRLRLEAQELRGALWARALGAPPGPWGAS